MDASAMLLPEVPRKRIQYGNAPNTEQPIRIAEFALFQIAFIMKHSQTALFSCRCTW